MEAYYYAQLNEDGVCVAVSQLSGPLDTSYMIRLTEVEYSAGLVGWRYVDGEWLEPQTYETLEELREFMGRRSTHSERNQKNSPPGYAWRCAEKASNRRYRKQKP